MLNSITLKEDLKIKIIDKFSKFINTKSKEIYNFIDIDGKILAKSGIFNYYSAIADNPTLYKSPVHGGFYILNSGISVILDKSKITIPKKYINFDISINITKSNYSYMVEKNFEEIESINLTLPKGTKFHITKFQYTTNSLKDPIVNIKITDCPIKSIIDSTLILDSDFINNFKLEQVIKEI